MIKALHQDIWLCKFGTYEEKNILHSEKKNMFYVNNKDTHVLQVDSFQVNVPILYPMKTSENMRF